MCLTIRGEFTLFLRILRQNFLNLTNPFLGFVLAATEVRGSKQSPILLSCGFPLIASALSLSGSKLDP